METSPIFISTLFFVIIFMTANSANLPNLYKYVLSKEGKSQILSCQFEDGRSFSQCSWSRRNNSLAKVVRGYGHHKVPDEKDYIYQRELGSYKCSHSDTRCFLEIFNISLIKDEGDWICNLLRPSPPDELFDSNEVHEHTDVDEQTMIIEVEVLRHPKLEMSVYHPDYGIITEFWLNRTYLVDCTTIGGSPKVHHTYAIFKGRGSNVSRHLDYSSFKASSELITSEPKFTRTFHFAALLDDGHRGGGDILCISEQITKEELIVVEIGQNINNTIYYPPFLIERNDDLLFVGPDFEAKTIKIGANPGPKADSIILRKSGKLSERILYFSYVDNVATFELKREDLESLSNREQLHGSNFTIQILTEMGKLEVNILYREEALHFDVLQVSIGIVCGIIILLIAVVVVIYLTRRRYKRQLRRGENTADVISGSFELIQQPGMNRDHRKLDRSQTWCIGDYPKVHKKYPNSPAYARRAPGNLYVNEPLMMGSVFLKKSDDSFAIERKVCI